MCECVFPNSGFIIKYINLTRTYISPPRTHTQHYFLTSHEMAKRAVLDVLTQTIGKYASLNPEELSVSLFEGKMAISDLSILPEAINADFIEEGSGLTVVSGRIASVNVSVPWSRLGSKSVVVHLQDLSLLVRSDHTTCPKGKKTRSSECKSEERNNAISHEDQKRRVERSFRAGLEGMANDDDGSGSSSNGFVAKLVRRIIENLHVEVSNVTIKVENENADVTLGVHLDEVSLFLAPRQQ